VEADGGGDVLGRREGTAAKRRSIVGGRRHQSRGGSKRGTRGSEADAGSAPPN